jgi:hypothetical protein
MMTNARVSPHNDQGVYALHRFTGITAFNAASPAGVMQYVRPSGCFSIQPFATMPAIVCLPAGCILSGRRPRAGLNFCNAVRSVAWGM